MTELLAARPNGDRLLTSLAIVNVNWEEGRKSYLDNFVPFALESMRRSGNQDWDSTETRGLVVRTFGLDLPVSVVDSLLSRATREQILVRDNKRYRFNPENPNAVPTGIARVQGKINREHRAVLTTLVDFAAERYDVEWTPEGADEALLNHVEGHAVPLLASAVEGRAYTASNPKDRRGADYIVSTFVVHLLEFDPTGFAHIEALVKGCMLAGALYRVSAGGVYRKFRDTTLYLDTPLILKALGHEGSDAEAATLQTLRLAASQGARLACFEHTVREVGGVLEAAKAAIRRAPGAETYTRGVYEHFSRSGLTESDVNTKIACLERDLEAARIEVKDKPVHESTYTVDEVALEEVMQTRVDYARRRTLEYDLDSLTAIHRIRRGSSAAHLETCRAVLVTDNVNLVGAARSFFRRDAHLWPVAMPEHELAALVWVKEPMAAPDLPRQQIIADCYSALAPTQSHWERIVAEIGRLGQRGDINAEEVSLLIHTNEAQRSLMDVTLGDPSKVNEASIKAALQRTREEIREPARAERDEALARAADAANAESTARFDAERAEAEARELHQQLASITEQHIELVARDKERHAADTERDSTIKSRAIRRAKWAIRLPLGMLVLVSGAAVALDRAWPRWTDHVPHWVAVVAWSMAGIVVALGVVRAVVKGTVGEWLSRPEQWLALRLERRYRTRAGLPAAAPDPR